MYVTFITPIPETKKIFICDSSMESQSHKQFEHGQFIFFKIMMRINILAFKKLNSVPWDIFII